MVVKRERANWRVEVRPGGMGHPSFGLSSCKDIAAQIKRHCDLAGEIAIKSDLQATCEHCGAKWTENCEEYNGGCCDEDERQWQESLAADDK